MDNKNKLLGLFTSILKTDVNSKTRNQEKIDKHKVMKLEDTKEEIEKINMTE